MKNDDELIMQPLRDMQYPREVDVSDHVMAIVRQMPTPRRQTAWLRWGRYAAAAAALVIGISVVATIFQNRNYNEPQICDMMASVYDSEYDFSDEYVSVDFDFFDYFAQ